MCPLRPTAIATPGATASSIAVLTTLSSLPASEVSSPELLRPTSGATYLIGMAAGAATARAGGGGAQASSAPTKRTAREQTAFTLSAGKEKAAGQLLISTATNGQNGLRSVISGASAP